MGKSTEGKHDATRALHLKAYEELKSKNVDRSVWASALADSDGDQKKAVSFYIRERAKILSEENSRIAPKVPIGGALYFIGAIIFLRILIGVQRIPGSIAGPESWFSLPWPHNVAVIFDDVTAAGLLIFLVYLAWLFTERSEKFPSLMLWYIAIEALAAVVGAVLWSMASETDMVSQNVLLFFATLLLAVFLVPYLLRSRRVQETFSRDVS